MTDETAGGLRALVSRLGEPAIRAGVATAMQRMGEAFVLGPRHRGGAEEGRPRRQPRLPLLLRHAWRGRPGPGRMRRRISSPISTRLRRSGRSHNDGADVFARDSVSVKLSALHPRYRIPEGRARRAGNSPAC